MSVQTQTTEHKRTRADVIRDKVKIRLAVDEAGPLIGALLAENGITLPGADWSKVFPNWLIATVDDEVVGCIQVMPAKPVGWCEFLYVKPSASFKIRAIAIRKLMLQGIATCHMAGSAYVSAMVDVKNDKFEEVLKKMNSVRITNCRMMAKRLVD